QIRIVGTYLARERSRGFAHSTADTAIGHAHDVVSIEKHIGLFHEAGVQSFAHSVPGLSALLGYSYVTLHMVVTVAVLAWAYRYHRKAFPLLRNALIVASSIAVLVYWIFPSPSPRPPARPSQPPRWRSCESPGRVTEDPSIEGGGLVAQCPSCARRVSLPGRLGRRKAAPELSRAWQGRRMGRSLSQVPPRS